MSERKQISNVHKSRRKRVPSIAAEKQREIVALFDMTSADYDYVAERTGVQRADVLALVLADTRRKGPNREDGSAMRPFIVKRQTA